MLHGVIVDAKTKFNICEFVLKFPWSSGLSKNDSENFAKNNNLEERQFNVDIEYKANDDFLLFFV